MHANAAGEATVEGAGSRRDRGNDPFREDGPVELDTGPVVCAIDSVAQSITVVPLIHGEISAAAARTASLIRPFMSSSET